eukprot:TRINITY_DN39011_c0_g1_i2.p1 TRINITY_DN39011_c0_g1~~TRINITY_DN39011_c0_g1_i2.p1  ORF type:complete len:311 (-),score=65.12 TRINITY_DN39011_c0_g1_i2:71-973(-)
MAGYNSSVVARAGSFGELKEGEFDAAAFREVLGGWLAPMHMECSPPFLVSWYNRAREDTADGTQRIEAPDDAVAFAVISVPRFLDVVAEHFARERPKEGFVDGATNAILEQLRRSIPSWLDAEVVNTDVGPPYFHVQTVGCVCANDQHVEAKDLKGNDHDEWQEEVSDQLEETRDPKMWGTQSELRRKIFGVNMHPVYGGWYAYRALVVLRKGLQAALPRPVPLEFLLLEDARRIISEYNLRHDNCLWRDLSESHPPEHRYSPEEFFFFTETSPAKRRRYLEMRAACMPVPLPPPRWQAP